MLSNSDTKKTQEIYLRKGRFSKKFKVKLPKGNWEVVEKHTEAAYGLGLKVITLARVENNRVVEGFSIFEGLLGGIYQAVINEAIYESIFL